jgi:SAM-dependent methyltransferase
MAIPEAQQKQAQQSQKPLAQTGKDQQQINELLVSYLHRESDRDNVALRFQHRINLCRAWNIPCKSHILDIGCGQGEASLALALLNGPSPTGGPAITAIDTAPPGYGGPFTLIEAQAYISKSTLGQRIGFLATDAPTLLRERQNIGTSPVRTFDAAVLCHSLWYFPNSETVSNLFAELARARVKTVCLAEYTGVASTPDQLPHELAATAQSLLFRSRKPKHRIQDWNVRTELTPADYLQIASTRGWRVQRSGVMAAPEGMIDGHREAFMVQSDRFREYVKEEGVEPVVQAEVLKISDTVRELHDDLVARGEKVRCMDTFWAVLVLDE